jgi:lipoyl(octanoyl) transferase
VEVVGAVDCAAQIAGDEHALRVGRPLVRTAVLTDRALSVGAATPGEAPFVVRARALGWDVLRRGTGGSGVLHFPGDVAWSIILPRGDPRVGRGFPHAYARFGAGVTRFLAARGVDGRWAGPPAVSDDCCLLSSRGSVLWVGTKVLGGAAQHVTGSTLLHHGILPWGFDPDRVAGVFSLPRTTVERSLTGLGEAGLEPPAPRHLRSLAEAIADALSDPS